jgi:hypothetical protein
MIIKDLEHCFGPAASRYLPALQSVLHRTKDVTYVFEDTEVFEERKETAKMTKDLSELNAIYWREMLYRAHLAACTSIRRNLKWIDATVLAKSVENALSFAASARSLMESVGDTIEVVATLPKNIATSHRLIENCIARREKERAVVSGDMEDALIAFSHARRVKKGETAPASHKAKQSAEYIRVLSDDAGLPDAVALYRELCELVHPASRSVLYQFESHLGKTREIRSRFSSSSDKNHIASILNEYRDTFDNLFHLAFEPALITLVILHRFNIFPKLSELRNFPYMLEKLNRESRALLRS